MPHALLEVTEDLAPLRSVRTVRRAGARAGPRFDVVRGIAFARDRRDRRTRGRELRSRGARGLEDGRDSGGSLGRDGAGHRDWRSVLPCARPERARRLVRGAPRRSGEATDVRHLPGEPQHRLVPFSRTLTTGRQRSRRWSTTRCETSTRCSSSFERQASTSTTRPTRPTGIGRFGWAVDPEGNRFELWEPASASAVE